MEDLILIEKGSCNLYGFQEYEGEVEKLLIARLFDHSWFGDYQILLEVESTFELEAGKVSRQNLEEGTNFIQVYKINGSILNEISHKYPEFRRFLLLRASQRRSHFLKNFEELKNIKELKRKKDDHEELDVLEEFFSDESDL